MFLSISILIVIVAIFLILIVIVQNSKGGGLAAGFASSNHVMGVRKTTDFLEKATWWCAGIVVVLCIFASCFLPHSSSSLDSQLKDDILNSMQNQNPDAATPFGTAVPDESE
ncbi:MAG: preprotein translocase subunit SecG [Dysgonamonadaceae bacterium]|jgi:preprotein translocase subunit SecG|nr:preprotein translocase subunit SecG [Dysgonamonadaceae bacterium]